MREDGCVNKTPTFIRSCPLDAESTATDPEDMYDLLRTMVALRIISGASGSSDTPIR